MEKMYQDDDIYEKNDMICYNDTNWNHKQIMVITNCAKLW